MRPRDRQRARQLEDAILAFHIERHPLPGIQDAAARSCLLEQIMESVHRVRYIATIREREICEARRDPTSDLFDPLKAAMLFHRDGCLEDAFWMVFLFVHFGRNLRGGCALHRRGVRTSRRWRFLGLGFHEPGSNRLSKLAVSKTSSIETAWRAGRIWKSSKIRKSRRSGHERHRAGRGHLRRWVGARHVHMKRCSSRQSATQVAARHKRSTDSTDQ